MDPLNFLLYLTNLTNRLITYYPDLKIGTVDPSNKKSINELTEEDLRVYLTGDLEIPNPLSIEDARVLLQQLETLA